MKSFHLHQHIKDPICYMTKSDIHVVMLQNIIISIILKVLTNSVCQPISCIIEADFHRCAWVKIITVSSTCQSCWVERHYGRAQSWNWSNGDNRSGSKYHCMRWQQRSNRCVFEWENQESESIYVHQNLVITMAIYI